MPATTPAPPSLAAPADSGCCAPSLSRAVAPEVARELARSFKALADPARVQLLAIVATRPGAEACVCDLTEPVGLSQPTVSHHLKILTEAGLLEREQRGRWAYFSLAPGALPALVGSLSSVTQVDGQPEPA
ncbi:putative transcriptional regulator, ArsR family protein [Paraoerskovia sediminicola]|uniref:Transcriptional regulator, ArsR family protein n=1 Tax=Paraoerskovia sediminicola TaxID=1138587 RepID=A0ABN6X8M8_9CELL|nr:metalloregulator ArsR/SmtB family transcription factor [Paraoerskovia sediminicola]BDZ41061.1 putative transcriptional regulator, ArsR family protein [Paraoerskovia sediminicola]